MNSSDAEGSGRPLAAGESLAEAARLAGELLASELRLARTMLDYARIAGDEGEVRERAVRAGRTVLLSARSLLPRLELSEADREGIDRLVGEVEALLGGRE